MSYRRRNPLSGGCAVVTALALSLTLPALAAAQRLSPAAEVLTSASSDLLAITFKVPEGQIRLTLPGAMALGDTVSGTLTLEPYGKASPDRLEALGRYRIDLDQLQVLAAQGALRWAIPSDLSTRSVAVVLRDPSGLEIGRAKVPLRIQPPVAAGDFEEFYVPRVGQMGAAFTILGPFDGDFATTEVRLAGRELRMVAESPRALVVAAPADLLGAAELVLSEQGLDTTAQYRAINILLAAPQTSLLEGERMTATATIEGLGGLELPISVLAVNRSPEVVTLEGSHRALLRRLVDPDAVLADGTATLDFTLLGERTGDFELNVAVEEGETPKHVPFVTFPPHEANVTFPPQHYADVTWPEHLFDVTFPPHYADVTWPDHLPDVSWPSHASQVTWPEHLENVTWPSHAANITWPEHVPELTWMEHRKNYTWVPPRPPADDGSE